MGKEGGGGDAMWWSRERRRLESQGTKKKPEELIPCRFVMYSSLYRLQDTRQ